MCVYQSKTVLLQGTLDVDCNQDHMTLPQEVLQQRTGSRNTRTTSLVSLVPNPTANGSSGHSGGGCGWWCIHDCACVLYICIYVCGACRLVLMHYLFTESNESRLCVFSRGRAELWSRIGPIARILELKYTHIHRERQRERERDP